MSPPANGKRHACGRAPNLRRSPRLTTSRRFLNGASSAPAAERLPVTFKQADAEALPFADGCFDVALSTFGVMFAPNQETAAAELSRVVRKGGRIGLANWTPRWFHRPALQDHRQARCATGRDQVTPRFGERKAASVSCFRGHQVKTFEADLQLPIQITGPLARKPSRHITARPTRAFAALDSAGQGALEAEIIELLERMKSRRQ